MRGVLLAVALLLAVPAIAWSVFRTTWSSGSGTGPMMHRVERGSFIHEITEQGDIESARNVEIVSKVKSGYGSGSGGVAILWIIPEGTYVEAGQKVCELDSSALELEKIQQEITVRNSEASVTQAENSFRGAEIAKQEYLNGTYREEALSLDNQIEEATEKRDRLKEYWEFSKGMHERGFVTKLQLQADYSALVQAQNQLDLSILKRKVLEDYKKEKQILQLDADIATAKAKWEAAKDNLSLDQERLDDIEEQFANCTIYTESAGQVVYANREGRRGGEGQIVIEEGVTVRERQAIIRLPDSKDMQVTAQINEAKISLVKAGMKAKIRLDAFPENVLNGEVTAVMEYPSAAGWGSTVKTYETVVKILDGDIPLRSGYTAEVKIRVEEQANVLQVPVQSVIGYNGKFFCVMRDGEKLHPREVSVGSTNDKFVVIESGLEEDEEVVLNAAAYREEVGLPKEAPKEEPEPSGDDATPGASTTGPGAGGMPNGAAMPSPAQTFQRLDANGDGLIDADELSTLPEQMRAGMMAADTDGDGSISLAEMSSMMARFGGAGGPPGGGAPGMTPGGGGMGGPMGGGMGGGMPPAGASGSRP